MAKVLASEKYNINRKHLGIDMLHFVSSADLAVGPSACSQSLIRRNICTMTDQV